MSLLRWSLAAVWLWTAAASLLEWQGQSLALLQAGGVHQPGTAALLIGGGAALDTALGVLLLFRPRPWVYAACMALVVVMTLVASVMLPALWLHPLGPLTKNVVILAALYLLYQQTVKDNIGLKSS